MICNRIESTAPPHEDAVLKAIFSQITAEIRKKGLVLKILATILVFAGVGLAIPVFAHYDSDSNREKPTAYIKY